MSGTKQRLSGKRLALIVCLLLAAAVLAGAYFALRPGRREIDVDMKGFFASSDGTLGDSVDFTVDGFLTERKGGEDEIKFNLIFPADVPGLDGAGYDGTVSPLGLPDYYYFTFLAFDPEAGTMVKCNMGLSTDMRLCVLEVQDAGASFRYLVGSAGGEIDREELLEVFDGFSEGLGDIKL